MLNKKTYVSALTVLLAVALTACDGGSSGSSSSNVESQVTEQPEVATLTPSVAGAVVETSATTIPASANIAPEFVRLVEEFLAEGDARGVSVNLDGLSVQYGDLDENAAGICFIDEKEVVIDNSFRSEPTERLYELIIHELGHCALGMEHRPNSIMQATGFIGVSSALLDEFFTERYFFEFGEPIETKYR